MIGEIGFNSATLYRYATVGLHQLMANLGDDVDAAVDAVELFVSGQVDDCAIGSFDVPVLDGDLQRVRAVRPAERGREHADEVRGRTPPDVPIDPNEPGGLGLPLVDYLTSNWGVYPGSTHVWFRFEDVSRPIGR